MDSSLGCFLLARAHLLETPHALVKKVELHVVKGLSLSAMTDPLVPVRKIAASHLVDQHPIALPQAPP